jgi:hypothetical protein
LFEFNDKISRGEITDIGEREREREREDERGEEGFALIGAEHAGFSLRSRRIGGKRPFRKLLK